MVRTAKTEIKPLPFQPTTGLLLALPLSGALKHQVLKRALLKRAGITQSMMAGEAKFEDGARP